MIKIKNINKSFKNHTVLKDISLTLQPGKFYGLLGNNGAGKTTLTKIIFNELLADSGEVLLNKINQKNTDLKDWYFFVENNELPLTLPVKTYIDLQANLHNISRKEINQTIDKFIPILDIQQIQHTLIKKISAGQKKLISLFVMFLVKPKYIFLDEPTANLDIKNKEIIFTPLLIIDSQNL